MSYAKQDTTVKRLQKEVNTRLDDVRTAHTKRVQKIWLKRKRELEHAIYMAYRQSAPRGKWSSIAFYRVKPALQAQIRSIIQQFQAESIPQVRSAIKSTYAHSVLLHAWMLDQVTPENIKIRLPDLGSMREADVFDSMDMFESRWTAWLDAYNSALVQNLNLNAINQGSVADAVAEVDATRINTPQSTIANALARIFDYESMNAISEGAQSIAGMNEDAVQEEIWKTRGDLRVCDECDELEGTPISEAEEYPPAHPNCHCYTEIVPASFAELLRSGDQAEWDLAARMDQQGVVPNALVIRGEDGSIAAKTIVEFEQWLKGTPQAVSGR